MIALVGMFIAVQRIQKRRNEGTKQLFRILMTSGMAEREIRKYIRIEVGILLGIALILPAIPFLVISQFAIIPLVLYLVLGAMIGGGILWRVLRKTTIEMEQEHV